MLFEKIPRVENYAKSYYGTFYEPVIKNNFTMKLKIFSNFIIFLLIGSSAFGQDTSANQSLSNDQTYPVSTPIKNYNVPQKAHIYRDTRLGSSSPYYNTYEKNDNGAGAVTTNPNKSGGISQYPNDFSNSSSNVSNQSYMDTRLGSSSPVDSTYGTNNNGAGAVTTNPQKR